MKNISKGLEKEIITAMKGAALLKMSTTIEVTLLDGDGKEVTVEIEVRKGESE